LSFAIIFRQRCDGENDVFLGRYFEVRSFLYTKPKKLKTSFFSNNLFFLAPNESLKPDCCDQTYCRLYGATWLPGNGCHGDRCALRTSTLYCGWLLPMSIIMLHNFVVFGLVLRVLCRKQPGGIHCCFWCRV